jgi:hypothetical protein
MQHPNSEVIKAWADGEEIQFNSTITPEVGWRKYIQSEHLRMGGVNWGPWNANQDMYKWRITPKKVMIRHATHGDLGTVAVYLKNYNKSEDQATARAEDAADIIWLDEWHEASFGPEKV